MHFSYYPQGDITIHHYNNHLERGGFYYSFKRLFRRSSYLRYNQYTHCGSVSVSLQLDWSEVTQTTVNCLNW